jgi:hypothetical protein
MHKLVPFCQAHIFSLYSYRPNDYFTQFYKISLLSIRFTVYFTGSNKWRNMEVRPSSPEKNLKIIRKRVHFECFSVAWGIPPEKYVHVYPKNFHNGNQ